MKLYHGSNVVVDKPLILPPEPGKTADFGTGFYTTTELFYPSETYRQPEDEQTKSWWESPRELCRDCLAAN